MARFSMKFSVEGIEWVHLLTFHSVETMDPCQELFNVKWILEEGFEVSSHEKMLFSQACRGKYTRVR